MLSETENKQNDSQFKKSKKFGLPLILFLGTILLILGVHYFEAASSGLEYAISLIENTYQQWFGKQNTSSSLILFPLAFIGGLLASVSPCILALLPVNLSYIGTIKITSRRDAFIKAGLFVLGNITILSMFGLFSSFASFVIVDFRGYINIIIGAIILVMGLSFAGVFHLPLPQTQISLPINGPYGVGLTFALVSSPCASPVLFAVLAAAAATGSQLLSVLTMVFYALGYTFIIFLASLFTGLVKQRQVLLNKSDWVIRFGSAALILAGGYYIVTGIRWFF
ncbi:cytochrome c biogenesis protein CcdA [Aphanizomenon sp. CS-733/32]|uniref:cytochrome c biogenesis protein CcdA n=1 Tax=Aphanizomenon sp. CS-733/32 TaxID=3021715 RepID=UPI00232E6B7B|nr:cytochrome c biogenesis protein CcdA [Aphanizomenon sp. CS-733/32]MDB9307749.1 cytochrome c biogenesis protein CcdA [Aphanizomenon sp. CS-733/32]